METDEQIVSTQYLTFTLGKEMFSINISKVREILNYTEITKVPRMPSFLNGVINLRGNVVPVVDLRMKLGMSAIQITDKTCIVIVEVKANNELTQMGVLIDTVSSVIDIEPDQIAPPPKIGMNIENEFLEGMGSIDGRFIIILNIDKVLSSDEIFEVGHVVKDPVTDNSSEVKKDSVEIDLS